MKNTGRKTVKGGSTSAPMVAKSSSHGPTASTTSATSAKTSTLSRAAGSAPPTQEQIAKRSFEIYLDRGAQPGHEADDWFQAVHELGG
jgi:Protein of unknown function (DUF2934)